MKKTRLIENIYRVTDNHSNIKLSVRGEGGKRGGPKIVVYKQLRDG